MCLEHWKEQEGYNYGLDAEIKKKMDAKFDPQKAAQAQAWLETLTGNKAHGSLQEFLKTGIILCQVLNVIKPNSIPKINSQATPFKERENIANYLQACKSLGMRDTDVFMTQDLYENANMGVVVDNIHALGAYSRKVGSFKGPFLGVKIADENKRNFTEEQLKANVPSRQTVGSYGYQDETVQPSIGRNIIKDVSGHKASSAPTKLSQGSYGIQVEKSQGLDKIIRNPEMLEANRGGNADNVKFCPGCGAAREGNAKFCSGCGNKY